MHAHTRIHNLGFCFGFELGGFSFMTTLETENYFQKYASVD